MSTDTANTEAVASEEQQTETPVAAEAATEVESPADEAANDPE